MQLTCVVVPGVPLDCDDDDETLDTLLEAVALAPSADEPPPPPQPKDNSASHAINVPINDDLMLYLP